MTLNSRHILILLGISLAMSSCAEFSMQDGKAELYPPVFKVDTHVEEITQTKGDPGVPKLTVPATQDIHFTVKDKDGKPVYDKQGVWSEALKMPAGSYTVEASYGSNTFGKPYYKGSCSGTIASGEEETPSITMSLCNALLATTLSEDLAVHFKADEVNPVRISTSSSSLDAGLGTYIFAPAGESLTVTISGQSSAGVDKTITHTIAPLTPATASYITCDMTTTNAPVITMSSNADDYGAWGTVAYIPFASTQNINAENAAKMEYLASSDGINFDIKGEIVEGVNVKFTKLETGKKYSFCAKVGNIVSDIKELTVASMPTIVVTATGTTSYDYYLASKNGDSSKLLEQANNTAPETVSGIGYSVSGIEDKLKQDKFGYSETLEYDRSTVPQNTTKEKQSWGKHTVSATVTFAGQTFNGYKDCHVTGLPYRAPDAIKFNDSNHSWTKKVGNGSINADSFNLSTLSGAPQADSPNFHIPSDIKITISNQYKKNNSSIGSYTYRVKIANSTEVIKHSSNSKGTYTLSCDETTLTPTMKYLSCHYSYEASGNNVTVNTMIINYK